MILLFFDRFSPFFPEPGVFTGSHIFFWDRNNVAVILASHVALWGTSFLREDFLNAFYPLVFYIYVDVDRNFPLRLWEYSYELLRKNARNLTCQNFSSIY